MKKKITALLAAAMLLSGCTDVSNGVPVVAEVSTSAHEAVTHTSRSEITSADVNADVNADTDDIDETVQTTRELPVQEAPIQDLPPVQKLPPDYEGFDAALSAAMENYSITGLTAALFKDGEVVYVKSLGYADAENRLPCTENTRYRIASVSKMISAMVLMTLYDKGVITPDTVLTDISDIAYDDPYRRESVRLRHLLTHTSGIVDTYEYDSIAVYTKSGINSLLRSAHSGSEPGTVYNYSNFGIGSVGALIERLTQEYFYDYADEALFSPLGMDAGYIIDKITDKESCAKLYDYDGEIFDVKNWGRTATYYDSFGLGNSYYLAQCELIITAPDLARLGMILAGSETGDAKVISDEAVDLMNKRWFKADDFDMGLCVRIYDNVLEGRTIYGHPGNALGCITGLFYDPSDGTGIAFLTNHCIAREDEHGFYKANKAALTAAYEYILDRL